MRVGVYHPQLHLLCATAALNAVFPPSRYTSSMPVILFGMRLLEVLFFIGLAGSAIVVC